MRRFGPVHNNKTERLHTLAFPVSIHGSRKTSLARHISDLFVGGGKIFQALMVSLMIVVADELADLSL